MERLPITYAALALAFGLLAFGLWTAVARLLRKPPPDLTSMERAIGYLMLGRFFGPLHTRLHARGERLTPLKGLGLALTIAKGLAARRQAEPRRQEFHAQRGAGDTGTRLQHRRRDPQPPDERALPGQAGPVRRPRDAPRGVGG